MLEGCPRGDVGAMDVGAVDVGNLARALHLSSGGTATGTYACETKLSQSLRRTAVLMHSVRTSVHTPTIVQVWGGYCTVVLLECTMHAQRNGLSAIMLQTLIPAPVHTCVHI